MKKSNIEKLKEKMERHNTSPATTTCRDFGLVSAGKGGDTLNASIGDKVFERELKEQEEGKLPFEHEKYLGDVTVK